MEHSFAQFDARERPALLRFAMALTGDAHMAEDLIADALARAFEQWPRIEAMEWPAAYVRRMVVNDHTSWRRRWSRATPRPLPAAAPSTDYAVEDYERRVQLAELLTRLPLRQRTAVVLRYYLDLSIDDIAENLQCSPATVRSHLSHAMKTLRVDATAPPSTVTVRRSTR